MSQAFHSIARTLAIAAAIMACGGHWALMQTVAWTGMLLDNTRSEPTIAAAVAKTFNGQNPCSLCQKIDLAHAEEETAPASQQKPVKIEALPAAAHAATRTPPPAPFAFPPFSPSAPSRHSPPPSPVPIRA